LSFSGNIPSWKGRGWVSQQLSIPIQITIVNDQIVNSGEFTGSLLIKYDDDRQILPIILRVKDPSWKPWIAIITGIILGLGMRI
jgi:hypothetical protein